MAAIIHVTIPEPCHENWHQMTPNEQGRFCMSCQKTVVDFSGMSDQEVLNHISRASAHICGRFTGDQLNKTYQQPTPPKRITFKYAWNMMVATFLLACNPETVQGKIDVDNLPIEMKDKEVEEMSRLIKGEATLTGQRQANIAAISGTIIDDSTGRPISFASIRIKGEEKGVSADKDGVFTLPGKKQKSMQTLVISAIGYKTLEYGIVSSAASDLRIVLKQEAAELAPVAVIAYGTRTISCRMGAVANIVRVSYLEKVKRSVGDLVPQKDIKVYPNPIVPGNSVNISLNIQQAGDYRLELLDAGGRLVYAQQLSEIQKIQTLRIPTQASWSRGIYWLRLTSPISKKVYNAKVLIQ